MIRYNLRCDRGHGFESWFQNSSAYESQIKRKLVNCPACGSVKVDKAIMAPQIARKKKDSAAPQPEAAASDAGAVPSTCTHCSRRSSDACSRPPGPVLDWARYKTPIRGLYLGGSGTHPGNGLTGVSGANAAREIIRDLR